MAAEFLDPPVKREGAVSGDRRAAAASEVARLAGKIALDYFERAEVSWKADDSMVTEADVAIQSWLEDEIAAAFPSDGILGEEGLTKKRLRPGAPFVWVIDPVDGTNNFGRGIPGFAISVGVLRDGMPYAGAVYDPVSSQLFTACVGHGAWLNGRRLRVEPVALSSRSLFSIRSPFSGDVPGYVHEWLTRYRLRRFGSTALQLCYVAAGALAFVHDHRASLWDIAGAAPVLLEAGGVLTAENGAPLFPVDPNAYGGEPIAFLAGDPTGHQTSLADIRRAHCGPERDRAESPSAFESASGS
jgi:myo-inositol-1(or 4)-monophosphatase